MQKKTRLAPKGAQLIDAMAPLIGRQYQLIEEAYGKPVFEALSAALEGFLGIQATPWQHIKLPPRTPVAAGRRPAAAKEQAAA